MKKYTNIIILFILVFLLPGCNEKILEQTPLDAYSDPIVWTNPDLASAYLNACYKSVGHGFLGVMLSGVADETLVGRGSSTTPYHLGTISADNLGDNYGEYGRQWYENTAWINFSNVQKINLFLDNIDKVSDSYVEPEKTFVQTKTDIMKGEALFLRAWFYTNICRTYGGLPIMDKANKLGDDFSTIKRATFNETVAFIVKDCDDAAQLLNLKSEMEMGRATKEAALALKSRMLLFAASDLTADGTAQNELVGYSNPDRTALWTAARDAAKAVIDLRTCKLADFGAPDQKAVAKNYFDFFKAYDLSNDEVIWGIMFRKDVGTLQSVNTTNGPNGIHNAGRNGPLQSMVDEYEMSDGSKFFDNFTITDDKYLNTSAKFHHENPYYDREPRFYGSVLYDSAGWQPRYAELSARDPLGIYDRRTRIVKEAGIEVSKTYGLDTRNSPVESWNGTYGGYLTKKFMDDTKRILEGEYNENVWIWMRYAEIILNYAEACLELNDIPTATSYINIIRNRAGLPDFTGDITLALRHERKVELYAEESRWYDIRRWKILGDAFSQPNYGIDITEVNDGGTRTTTWSRIIAQEPNNFDEKIYWIPIATDELKRAPQLEQNPGY
jgi:starch-binding outer membrane protein, SusD/RagB family